MFHHILFPVDFSPRCYGAVPFVKAFVERNKASLTLVHVVERPPIAVSADAGYLSDYDIAPLKQEAEQQLAGFAAQQFPRIVVNRVVEEGDPAQCIADLAHTWNADLVMMPTQGRGVLGRTLFGSVTAGALHACDCAIWTGAHLDTSTPATRTQLTSVLCAIELVPESIALLKYAREIGLESGANVHIVHAVPTSTVRPEMHFDQPLELFLEDYAREEIAKLQTEAGTNFDSFVAIGGVPKVVHDAAEKFSADLIIIGRGIVNRFAGDLRTEAYGILREAPCPVISV